MNEEWVSYAQWPAGTLGFDNDISTDIHPNLKSAEAVCQMLQRQGFGCLGTVFPVRVWCAPRKRVT